MKRITVSLPDDLVDRVRRAAGGDGQVSSYVAKALADYESRETLDEIVASWQLETPVPDEVRRQAATEMEAIGLGDSAQPGGRMTR